MKIFFQSYLSSITGTNELDIEFSGTLEELLSLLIELYGFEFESLILIKGELSYKAVVLVNNCFIDKKTGFDKVLYNSDVIMFLPVIAGG